MRLDRLIVVGATVAAVVVLIVLGTGGDEASHGASQSASSAPEGAVRVSFAYSPEKENLLEPLIDDFNASGAEADGAPVFVEGKVVTSGDAVRRIAAGILKPVAWSPASSLWGRLLNYRADRELTADDAPSIVRTPLVIAMWEPMARVLGWPDEQIGFADILGLARSKAGWAAYGHPEFGDFKLVHTNPNFSTSGLSAVVAEYSAATGKREGLLEEDIDGSARRKVREIERSIVHYGDTTLFVADQMREGGPSYASAAAMEEVTLLDFNRDRAGQPKLVAIYPKEGTFFSDNPFFILDGEWVTNAQRAGAEAFESYLADRVTPELAAESDFRPADLSEPPAGSIATANGADPSQPRKTLSLPSPEVLAKIRAAWRQDRKPANAMLVIDVSGSMADQDRLERAKQGLRVFLDQIQPDDHVGLIAFDDQVHRLLPVRPFSETREALERTISGLQPEGGTAFRDATYRAFNEVDALAGRGNRINAVVVLTDGEDTDSARSLRSVVHALSSQGDSASQVRVYTIAYSATAEGAADALKEIAEASGGQAYEGDTEDIERVYRAISSFF